MIVPREISGTGLYGELIEKICGSLLKIDEGLKQIDAVFAVAQSNLYGSEWTMNYVQTFNGLEIMGTGLSFHLRPNATDFDDALKYLLKPDFSLHGANGSVEQTGNHALFCEGLEKRLVAYPNYNENSPILSDCDMERIINKHLEAHGNNPNIEELTRKETYCLKELLLPLATEKVGDGVPVQLHRGKYISVGDQYTKGKPFKQFLHLIIDTEEGRVLETHSCSLLPNETRRNIHALGQLSLFR